MTTLSAACAVPVAPADRTNISRRGRRPCDHGIWTLPLFLMSRPDLLTLGTGFGEEAGARDLRQPSGGEDPLDQRWKLANGDVGISGYVARDAGMVIDFELLAVLDDAGDAGCHEDRNAARDAVAKEKSRDGFHQDHRDAHLAQHQSGTAGSAAEITPGDDDVTGLHLLGELRPVRLHGMLLQVRHVRIFIVRVDRVGFDGITKFPNPATQTAVEVIAH